MQRNCFKCITLELYSHLDDVIQKRRDYPLWNPLWRGLGSDSSQHFQIPPFFGLPRIQTNLWGWLILPVEIEGSEVSRLLI